MGLWILAGILTLLLLPVRIHAQVEETQRVTLRWLGLQATLYDSQKPPKAPKAPKAPKKEKKPKGKKGAKGAKSAKGVGVEDKKDKKGEQSPLGTAQTGAPTGAPAEGGEAPTAAPPKASEPEPEKKSSLFGDLPPWRELWPIAKKALITVQKWGGALLRALVVQELCIQAAIGGQTAADAAKGCGEFAGQVGSLYATASHVFTLRKLDLDIVPSYYGPRSYYAMAITVRVRPLVLFSLSLLLVGALLTQAIAYIIKQKTK